MEATLTSLTVTIGLILVIVGLLLKTFPPTKINSIYGYMTSTSRRNLDTWKVANSYKQCFMKHFRRTDKIYRKQLYFSLADDKNE